MSDLSTRLPEDVLGDCISGIQEQGKTVADCLARYPHHYQELEPLLHLIVQLQAARKVQASPEFRRVAVTRMHNLIAAQPRQVVPETVRPNLLDSIRQRLSSLLRTQRRRAFATAIGIVLTVWLLVGGGVVYASADALPGDALYPVKRVVEATQLAVSLNEAQDVQLRLNFAARRLNEAATLLQLERPGEAGKALADYQVQIEMVLASFEANGRFSPQEQEEFAQRLLTELEQHETKLDALLRQAPQPVEPLIQIALMSSQTAREQALAMIGSVPEDDVVAASLTPAPSATPVLSLSLPSVEPQQRPFTPTPKPSRTPTHTSAPPTPSVTPTAAWQKPHFWPEGCPFPPAEWPNEWPETCQVPREWMEWWAYWPEDCPLPPDSSEEWPQEWPQECSLSREWVEPWWDAWWENWPEECPLPPNWSEEWPDACTWPPEEDDPWWQDWAEECVPEDGQPYEWSEECLLPTIIPPTGWPKTLPTVDTPPPIVQTVILTLTALPPIPTIIIPTVVVPANIPVETPPIPTLPPLPEP